jgi:hypothetical protein
MSATAYTFQSVSGYSGFTGFSGFSGIPGAYAASGISGFSGYVGQTGNSGYSGFTGYSGYSGISGSGVSGYSGIGGGAYQQIAYVNTFSAGQVVARIPGGFTLALADTSFDAEAIGVVQSSTGSTFTIVYNGIITGLSGLSDGVVYFLSDTVSGLMTTTPPSAATSFNKPIMIATGSTTGIVLIMRGVLNQASSGFSGVFGGGTSGYYAKWVIGTTTPTISSGIIYDTGTSIGVGTTTPNNTLTVVGSMSATGNVYGNSTIFNTLSTGSITATNLTVTNTLSTNSIITNTFVSNQVVYGGVSLSGSSTGFALSGGSINSKILYVPNTVTLSANDGASLFIGNGGSLGTAAFTPIGNYAPATASTSILAGNGSGGFSPVTIGTGLVYSGGVLYSVNGYGTQATLSGSSVQTIADSLETNVVWNSTNYDDYGIWGGKSTYTGGGSGLPYAIGVPAGISRVRVSALIRWDTNTSGYRFVKVKDNFGNVWAAFEVPSTAYGYVDLPSTTALINIAGTGIQYFYVTVYESTGGSSLNIRAGSTFTVEAVR